jgi:hypothetical protein
LITKYRQTTSSRSSKIAGDSNNMIDGFHQHRAPRGNAYVGGRSAGYGERKQGLQYGMTMRRRSRRRLLRVRWMDGWMGEAVGGRTHGGSDEPVDR